MSHLNRLFFILLARAICSSEYGYLSAVRGEVHLHSSGVNNRKMGISSNRPMYMAKKPIIFPASETCDQSKVMIPNPGPTPPMQEAMPEATTCKSTRGSPDDTTANPKERASQTAR